MHKSGDHPGNSHHTVVSNPNDLFNVNQQQHIQHQLMIHQQQQNNQRRRSSVYQPASQHTPIRSQTNPSKHQQSDNTQQHNTQDVKVEITEVKL